MLITSIKHIVALSQNVGYHGCVGDSHLLWLQTAPIPNPNPNFNSNTNPNLIPNPNPNPVT